MNLPDLQVRHVLDNLPSLAAILDREFRYVFANQQHIAWFGEAPDFIRGRHLSEVIGNAAFEQIKPSCIEAISGAHATYTGEISFERNGSRFIHASSGPIDPGDGSTAILCVVSDVSELRRTQQALSSSTVRGQTILDTAVDAIVTIDEDGVIQSCNASCSKLFGFAASEMLGRNVKMLMPGAYAGEHDGYLKRYRETGEKHIIGIGREVTGRKSNGSEFPAHLAVGEFSNMGRRYFTGFIRDMTDQRAAEEAARRHLDELAHVTRIHAIDSLAAGISHEVNQPLTAIVTMSQALLRTLRNGNLPEAMLIDTLERVVTQATRASSIVTQMREMVRKQKSEEVSLQYVDEIVSDVLDLLQDELRNNNIEVRQEPPLRRHHVMANRIQVEQVMLNLIQNAVHAMADNDDERILRIVNAADEDKRFVEVRVQDSGPGLPTGDGADVFSPFFTTKEKGLGQGLTISRAIAERHGGSLDAMPAATRGALFSFRLPFADGE